MLDTNIVLDLFVFSDAAVAPLRQAIEQRRLAWLATRAMRDELARVLAYTQIAARLQPGAGAATSADTVLARFDALARIVERAAKAPITCKDPDDQGFIDLAVAHRARLISKDKAVLVMHRRMERLGARAHRIYTP